MTYPIVDAWFDEKRLENEVLERWERGGIFEKLKAQNEDGAPWSFIDGPITSNNRMGIHHAWGRSLKDAYQRYYAMNGRKLRYQNGFDCQGLWIEVEVEKELGFTSKRDIESYGVDRFVEKCKERALRFADVITKQSKRLGYWMNWDDSYYTLSDENNYAIWGFLRKCHDRHLLYRGHDVMPWCPRCGTGISQHEMSEGYEEVEHASLYVALSIRNRSQEHLVVWTTTPWTLAANVAVAVNPELEYARVVNGDSSYWVAGERVDVLCGLLGKRGADASIGETVSGSELIKRELSYEAPFDHLPGTRDAAKSHRIIPWADVSADEGTGLVHIAPGCGDVDHQLGTEFGLPSIAPVDESGRFIEGFGELTGLETHQVTTGVVERLTAAGMYVGTESYAHSYPHCWRCGTELIFRLVDEWFIAMDPWRDEIMRTVEQATWIPSHGRDLELDWLRNMRDWMISKKRYWGLALPIWVSDGEDTFEVVGSRDELSARAVEGWEQFQGHSPHRPWIDAVRIEGSDGRILTRVPDVGNPWLDAGIVPYSTVGYDTDREYWSTWFPADLVLESFPGQFRNWFYSLLAMSTMMEGSAPFRTLVGHGMVRDEYGEEMHKSKGNAIWFDDAVEMCGSEVLRWLFFTQDVRNDVNFSNADARHIRGGIFNSLWNSHAFFVNYARISSFDPGSESNPPAERSILDRWLLVELKGLIADVRTAFEAYDTRRVTAKIVSFVDKMSNWYIRRSRRRFWRGAGGDQRDAFATLYQCLETLCRLIAPLVPLFSDEMYRNITAAEDSMPESVHLRPFPSVAEIDMPREQIGEAMSVVIDSAAMALNARKRAGIKNRQPLRTLIVSPATADALGPEGELIDLLLAEVNVKRLELRAAGENPPTERIGQLDLRRIGRKFGRDTPAIVAAFNTDSRRVVDEVEDTGQASISVDDHTYDIERDDLQYSERPPSNLLIVSSASGDSWVAIDTEIDDELRREGIAREFVRRLQVLRKDRGFAIEDRIRVSYESDGSEVREAIGAHDAIIRDELLAVTLEEQPHVADGVLIETGSGTAKVSISRVDGAIADRN